MKCISKIVTLCMAEIVDESRLNHYELKAEVWQKPDMWLKYTLEICRQQFSTFSQNQKYSVGNCASVMLKDGKYELLYDSIFNNLSPFSLNNPWVKLKFFGGEDIIELNNCNYYILKKGFKREKSRRNALKTNPNAVKTQALIIQRKSYGEWQINAKGYVRFTLTLLLKDGNDYFITTFTDWDKTERFSSVLKHTFDLSVGEIVPVIYNSALPADIMIDYDNLKPFSFKSFPHIHLPENEEQDTK